MSEPISLRLAVSHPPGNAGHLATTFVVDGALAIDAGAIASRLSLEEQWAVRHVLLTHAHLDHVCELPQFVDNLQTREPGAPPQPLTLHAERATLEVVGRHVFGGVWPDVIDPSIGFASPQPFDVEDGGPTTIAVADFDVHVLRTVHRVPTVGYVLRRGERALAIFADTGQETLLESDDMAGVTLMAIECSYPNRLAGWAKDHGHLTPELLAELVDPLLEGNSSSRLLVHHLKPVFADEVARELEALRGRGIDYEIARDGRVIEI